MSKKQEDFDEDFEEELEPVTLEDGDEILPEGIEWRLPPEIEVMLLKHGLKVVPIGNS
jgi:hypothetical protein